MRLTWAISLPLSLAAGCGSAVSLDDPIDGSGEPPTSAGPFDSTPGSGGDGSTAGASLDDGPMDGAEPKLDVAPDIPLPPGACPPDCQFELTTAWTYDGAASLPSRPLDPEDQVAVIVEPNGSITVAEERQGAITLARLDTSGQELWTMPLALPCDPCRLVELALHPSGDLLIAGHGVDATASPAALVARVELGGPNVVWATSTSLATGPGIVPRAGSLVVHDEDLLFQPVLEGSAADGLELLELLAYDGAGGGLVFADTLAAGLASGDAPGPRAAYDTRGLLVITHPAWTGAASPSGTMRWLTGVGSDELASAAHVEPGLHLATGPDGRALSLGQTPGMPSSVLHLDSGRVDEPEQWSIPPFPLGTTGHPTLAVDAYGHAHVLARVAQGPPARELDVGVQVLRWSNEGELVWKLVLPLAVDRVDDPISLALTHQGDLVLGGLVAGARHVEMRWPSCDC